jgi:hypothetical protein
VEKVVKMRFTKIGLAAGLLGAASFVWGFDLNDTFSSLKAAVEKKDVAAVKTLAPQTSKESLELLAKEDTPQELKDFAKGANEYSEYALAISAAQSTDSKVTIEFMDMLLKQNPKSEYADTAALAYIDAQAREGPAKAAAAVQKVLAFSKPKGDSEADWEKKRSSRQGLGFYYTGLAAGGRQAWAECDRSLRAAEPLIRGDARMLGITYFYLGLANYQIGKLTQDKTKIQAGLKYSQQSAAIPGPMQGQANTNVAAMSKELGTPAGRR